VATSASGRTKTERESRPILIRLNLELDEALRARAELEGRRLAPVIRSAIRRYLREPLEQAS
jgi:hypothetical protein